jgi:hypothetical protein
MADKYVHNNSRDPKEERFEQLEVQVFAISHNMNLLMETLASKLRPFGDDGGSNLEIESEGKSGDWEDSGKESRKEYEKEQSS